MVCRWCNPHPKNAVRPQPSDSGLLFSPFYHFPSLLIPIWVWSSPSIRQILTLFTKKLNLGHKFKNSVKNFCDSIQTVHKIFREDGKVVLGIYVVLDKVEKFTQDVVLNSLDQVIEKSEKTSQFIGKTF